MSENQYLHSDSTGYTKPGHVSTCTEDECWGKRLLGCKTQAVSQSASRSFKIQQVQALLLGGWLWHLYRFRPCLP